MLTDPLSVTYNGNGKSLPVVTGFTSLDLDRVVATRKYATADGEFSVVTRQGVRRSGDFVGEIHLVRKAPDTIPRTSGLEISPTRSVSCSVLTLQGLIPPWISLSSAPLSSHLLIQPFRVVSSVVRFSGGWGFRHQHGYHNPR